MSVKTEKWRGLEASREASREAWEGGDERLAAVQEATLPSESPAEREGGQSALSVGGRISVQVENPSGHSLSDTVSGTLPTVTLYGCGRKPRWPQVLRQKLAYKYHGCLSLNSLH